MGNNKAMDYILVHVTILFIKRADVKQKICNHLAIFCEYYILNKIEAYISMSVYMIYIVFTFF